MLFWYPFLIRFLKIIGIHKLFNRFTVWEVLVINVEEITIYLAKADADLSVIPNQGEPAAWTWLSDRERSPDRSLSGFFLSFSDSSATKTQALLLVPLAVIFDSPFKLKKPPNGRFFVSPKSKPSGAGSIWRRKKDSADVQFSRLLRKLRKRNDAEFFWRGAGTGTRTPTRWSTGT